VNVEAFGEEVSGRSHDHIVHYFTNLPSLERYRETRQDCLLEAKLGILWHERFVRSMDVVIRSVISSRARRSTSFRVSAAQDETEHRRSAEGKIARESATGAGDGCVIIAGRQF
jgi:hypothetical protein